MKDGYYIIYDIGTYSAKSTLIEVSKGQKKLSAIDYELIKPAKEFLSEVDYYNHIQEIIKVLSSRLPINYPQASILVLNHRDIQVKIIDLPETVTKDNYQQTLFWEARKLLNPNYKNEPFIYGWETIRETPNISVLLAVAPHQLIEKYEKIFSELGIFLDVIIPTPFCNIYYKNFLQFHHNPNATISFIEIGHSSSNLQIYSNSELKFFRIIPAGAYDFIDTLATNDIESFAQKIRFSFDYFRASTKISSIETIILAGGGAKVKELFEFMREYFHPANIDFVDFSRVIDTSLFESKFQTDSFYGFRYINLLPYSTALAAFGRYENISISKDERTNNIDFLRFIRENELKNKFNVLAKRVFFYSSILGIVLIAIIIYFWQNLLIYELQEITNRTNVLKNSITATNFKINQKTKSIIPSMKFIPQEKSFLEPLFDKKVINYSLARLLYFIERKRPKGIKVFKIEIKSKEELEEEVISSQDLLEYIKSDTNTDNEVTSSNTSIENDEKTYSKLDSNKESEFFKSDKVETIGGQVIQIIGTTPNLEIVGSYVQNLNEVKLFRKLRYIKFDGRITSSPEKFFIIQGELR